MFIALDPFYFDVPFTMMFDTVLSFATCVGGYECPISSREFLMNVAFWQFSNNFPNYASMADAMIFLTGLFYGGIACIGVSDFGPRKKYSPDLLRASGYDI